ncbi:MAG TPA: acyl-CoA dehydrogenase [Flavobacteriaceae bacterium]|jgi:alkylation response protein AidB-like acyl-CoA dehydrogenase|nr:acyl-CoA dehydrogenase [Flavobacteriaceae bacterium]
MEYFLTPEQQMIRDSAREYAQQYLLPGVIERDLNGHWPNEQIAQMGQLGFMGMMVDPQWGGSGLDSMSYVLAMEEISKIDASASVIMSVNNSLVCWGLEKFGSEAQKEKYLPGLASGKLLGAFCLSEPEAGSDASSQKTKAEDRGDCYLVNGTKNWITNGGHADVYLVMAQTDASLKSKGINALIIEKGAPGFDIGPKEQKMGIRSSDTHTLQFSDVRVPKENRIGDEGFGFAFAMKTLAGGRLGIAAQALGLAQGAYERSVDYAKQRKTFGQLIGSHQAIAFKLAKMATDIEAARLLVYKAAQLKDRGASIDRASAMAKYWASKAAMEVTTEAVQIHGGNGYVVEYHVERMMRDAKITQIYEGTTEIQQMIIARGLGI